MASVGMAAAEGLQSGFGLGLRMRSLAAEEEERAAQREDRARRRRLEDENRAWQREDRQRRLRDEDDDRELKALEAQAGALRNEFEGYAARYGQDIPVEVDASYRQRVQRVTAARDGVLRRRLQGYQDDLSQFVGAIKTDPESVRAMAPERIVRALAMATRRDPRDLLSQGDQPSRVDRAVTEIVTGMETGNEVMLLRGANVLLEPELRVGVGQESPHGGVILGKRVHAMVPHPQKPGEFTPMLRVYVGDGKIDTADEKARNDRIRQEDPDAPPGATGYYLAPVTENRSTDPADPVRSISVERAMDYAARLQTLSKMVNSVPELREKVAQGLLGEGPRLQSGIEAFFALGGRMQTKQQTVPAGQDIVTLDEYGREVRRVAGKPLPPKVTRERVDLGDRVYERAFDDLGNVVGEQSFRKGAAPSGSERGEASGAQPGERPVLAARLGVPVADRDPFAGMSEKGAEVFRRSLYQQADRKLNEADEAVGAARSMAQDAQRFLELQKQVRMQGPGLGSVWAISSEAQEMDAISDRITPQMRQPGSGATSDFDAKMFRSATVTRTKNEAANEAIAQAVILRAQDATDRAQFMRDYLSVNGHLDGAERQWKRYVDANPIFDPGSRDTPRLNPSRVPYQRFFSSETAASKPPASPSASSLPAAARSMLKEGQVTTFGNGQRWTLRNGQPVQVR